MKQAVCAPSGVWTLIVSLAAAPLLGGCGLFGSPVPEGGRSVREVYDNIHGADTRPVLQITPHPEPGAGPQSRPVIYPPEIFAAYVEEHVDSERDMMIGGHWIYFKLRDSSWTKQRIDQELSGAIPLDDEMDLEPLRKAFTGDTLRQILVPYQADTSKRPTQKPKEDTPQWNSKFIRNEGGQR